MTNTTIAPIHADALTAPDTASDAALRANLTAAGMQTAIEARDSYARCAARFSIEGEDAPGDVFRMLRWFRIADQVVESLLT